jgi:hypothetical protein
VLAKHLITPDKMAELRSKGKFVIEPDDLQDHKLSSENSEATVVVDDGLNSGSEE